MLRSLVTDPATVHIQTKTWILPITNIFIFLLLQSTRSDFRNYNATEFKSKEKSTKMIFEKNQPNNYRAVEDGVLLCMPACLSAAASLSSYSPLCAFHHLRQSFQRGSSPFHPLTNAPGVYSSQRPLRCVQTSNEHGIHWLKPGCVCCKPTSRVHRHSARSMSAARTIRNNQPICQPRYVTLYWHPGSKHAQLIARKTTIIGWRTVQERASGRH